LAAKPSNLIPRRKGESDAEFIKRVHSTLEAKKQGRYGLDVKAAAKKLEARKEAQYRRELQKRTSRTSHSKAEPIRYRKVTRAVEISNPLKGGSGFRRVQERVKA
jgi:hypothetical protein